MSGSQEGCESVPGSSKGRARLDIGLLASLVREAIAENGQGAASFRTLRFLRSLLLKICCDLRAFESLRLCV